MTNAIEPAYRSLPPTSHEMAVYQHMAKQAVSSKLYRALGDESAVMTIMLAARELGIPPMAAINKGINLINGQTEISARQMAALILRQGHIIRKIESTPEKCTLLGIRANNGEQDEETFTLEEAKQAGLIREGGNWKKWPKDMLYARCLSRLARRLFADIIGMSYVEGEIRESNMKPDSSMDAAITVIETLSIEDQKEANVEKLATFLKLFDYETGEGWRLYIEQLQEKLKLTLDEILAKYADDPTAATEKYQLWAAKQRKD